MIVSFDHAVGLISAFSVLGFHLYVFLSAVAWIIVRMRSLFLKLFSIKGGPKRTSSSSTTTTTTKRTSNNILTIGLVIVAYELSPLLTMTTTTTTTTTDGDYQFNYSSGLYDIIKGTNTESIHQILQLAPSILKGPTPPLLLSNRHLQLIPWMFQNTLHTGDIPYQRIDFEVSACLDKTQLPDCKPSSFLHDTITIDIFPPFDNNNNNNNNNNNDCATASSNFQHTAANTTNFTRTSPIIFFQPGLRSHSQDLPGNMIVRRAYAEGFRSVVVNRRGHTPGRRLKAPRFNFFGDVEDFEQVYWYVKHELAGPNTPLFLHGISSGTAVTVSSLGKWDKRRSMHDQQEQQKDQQQTKNEHNNENNGATAATTKATDIAPTFVASISVTPGYDISRAMNPQRFAFPYNDVLTYNAQEFFVIQNKHVLQPYHPTAYEAALNATTLEEFINVVAPFAGYETSQEYYKHENPVTYMEYITTPTLVLNSKDDPCCSIQNLYETSPYENHNGKTYDDIVRASPNVIVAVTKTGSHCPFLDGKFIPFVKDPLHGGFMLNSWADTVSIEYYKAALQVYNDRRFL